MSMTTHERPGVYSSYEASTLVTGSEGAKVVGLAVLSSEGTPGKAELVTTYDQAAEIFGGDDKAAVLARAILANGAAGVAVVPVATETKTDYQAAFTALLAEEDVKIVVCDSTETEVQQALRDHVQQASQLRLERIAVVEGAKGESVTQLTQRAAGLNSERVVLAAPGQDTEGLLAAAVAGAIAGESDPAVPLGGARLTETEVTGRYSDNDLDQDGGGGGQHLAGADHHPHRGRGHPGHPGRPAQPVPAGQEHRADPGGHPVPGGAGAGGPGEPGDHHRL